MQTEIYLNRIFLMVLHIKQNFNIFVILICFVITIFAATGINREVVGLGHDDGIYVILGKALSEGEGYRLINLPSSPYQAKYPAVYPFLISCVWPAGDFPDNIFYIKLINIFFLFLILLETCYICMALFDGKKNLSFYIVMLTGMSQWVLYFSINAFSEIPFLFFSLTAALLFVLSEKKQMQGRDNSIKYIFYFLAILSASIAYQTRTFGLALLMNCILYFFLKKNYKVAVSSLLLICALNLPWIIWAKAHAPSADSNPLLLYYAGYSLSTIGMDSVLELVSKLKVILFANISYLCKYVPEIISSISTMLKPLADVVYGSRFSGGPHRVLFFWHYVGNRIITTFSNMLSNLNLTDMETGYKAFRRKVIQSLNLKANRFGFEPEPEVTMKLAKGKYRIYEVPISYWG